VTRRMKNLVKRSIPVMFLAAVLLPSPRESTAGVVPADSIRAAVVDTLTAWAEGMGFRVEVTVPAVANVLVKGVEAPRIRVGGPVPAKGVSHARTRVAFIGGGGDTAREITVMARMKWYARVFTTAVDLKRGDRIEPGDVVIRETNVTGLRGYFTDISELSGLQAGRTMKAGTVLTRRNTGPVPVVRRGDRVTIRARVGNVVITAVGTAREDGTEDECIRVYNVTTKKTLKCRVVDANTVVLAGEGG